MSIRTFLKPLSFIPAFFMMYVIFSFSAQEAPVSSSLSYKISYTIVEAADEVMDLDLNSEQIDRYSHRIEKMTRKAAHVGEYFLLAISVSFPLYVYGMHGLLLMLVAGIFCIAYAAGDEYHQTLVLGRSGEVRDICIDGAGVLLGVLLVRIIGWTGRMTLFRPDPYVEEKKRLKKLRKQEERRMKKQERRYEEMLEETRRKGTKPERRPEPPNRYARHLPGLQDIPYMDELEDEDNATSDQLSEDMPFSKLFRPKNRRS